MQTDAAVAEGAAPILYDVSEGGDDARLAAAADVTPGSFDAERNTVEVMFYDGSQVRRGGFMTEPYMLEFRLEGMRFDRLTRTGCVLKDHRSHSVDAVIGSVLAARVEGGKCFATLKLSTAPDAESAVHKIREGALRGVSMGVFLGKRERRRAEKEGELDVVTVLESEVYEISFTPTPAIPGAGTLSAAGADPLFNPAPTGHNREVEMKNDTSAVAADATAGGKTAEQFQAEAAAALRKAEAAEAARLAAEQREARLSRSIKVKEIFADFEVVGVKLSAERKAEILEGEMSLEDVYGEMQGKLAAAATQLRPHHAPAEAMRADTEFCTAMMSGIEARAGRAPVTPDNRPFVGRTLAELAERAVARSGRDTEAMTRDEVIRVALAHGSSDFPMILANTANKSLRAGYDRQEVVYPRIAERTTLRDFKQATVLRLGDAPGIVQLAEGEPIPHATLGEEKEVIAINEYGRRLGGTRKLVVNDDLDALTRLPAAVGGRVRRFEEHLVLSTLDGNPTLSDAVAMFAAARGNLAGAGAAVSETALVSAIKAMMLYKGVGDEAKGDEPDYILAYPKIILTGPKQHHNALKANANVLSVKEAEVNTQSGKWEILTSPYLSKSGAEPWYCFADPMSVPAIMYAYLEGSEGAPAVETRDAWEHTGFEMRIVHEFGVGGFDWRGAYKNPGIS